VNYSNLIKEVRLSKKWWLIVILLPLNHFLVYLVTECVSVTYQAIISLIWALKGLLCYLSSHYFARLGTKTPSLLPFKPLFRPFGHRDAFSVTFQANILPIWVLRRLLCYLSSHYFAQLDTESDSLLPFRTYIS